MNIYRPAFATPILIIDGFLAEDDARLCLQECIDLKSVYMPATVGAGAESKINPKIRVNDVVHLNAVFQRAPERSSILRLLKQRIADKDCNALWHEGDLIFDVANYATWKETVLSRYGRCDFYGKHQDTVRDRDNPGHITRRIVTLVYYLNVEPERFFGGGLRIYKGDHSFRVEPRHNRAVVFPSFTFHEVENVQLPEDAPWEHGRFSVNHWMGFKEASAAAPPR